MNWSIITQNVRSLNWKIYQFPLDKDVFLLTETKLTKEKFLALEKRCHYENYQVIGTLSEGKEGTVIVLNKNLQNWSIHLNTTNVVHISIHINPNKRIHLISTYIPHNSKKNALE